MHDSFKVSKSPLSIEEIEKIDSSGLPLMARHRIRLLAHCLSCFKAISSSISADDFPSNQERLTWLIKQPNVSNDREFVSSLLEQLSGAERHLRALAIECNTSPLDLTLDDLIDEGVRTSRLSNSFDH